ncbi:MAG: condensation domain-containing protein [Bacteroidota bacterium]
MNQVSSGKPKGVLVKHGQLYFSTQARAQYYPENPSAFLLLSSFSFDSSVAGIFWTTTTGGQLVIAPRRIEQNLPALADIIEQRMVSHTLLLPSLYEAMLRFLPIGQLKSLKAVIVAGEACPSLLIESHFSHLPQVGLYNEYGPTEATVWCSVAELRPDDAQGDIPIGRPIPGGELLILDEQQRQQPVGVPGELYVGGPGLTGGYWQRPELTESKFVSHPFKAEQKLYRTGDLARWRGDGQIDFLGRVDEQVKVRGYRIELGEVASFIQSSLTAIGDQPAVSLEQVAVSLSKQGQLVAYIVGEFHEKNLRVNLSKQLPAYMVPTHYVRIEEIPRLPNGKIDRKSLPDPKSSDAGRTVTATDISDLSPTEASLLEIWKDVLGTDQIDLNDNFFEIGGDSISSIQIVARAREVGITLAPTAIFEQQTISQLALFAQQEVEQDNTISSDAEPGPLIPIQRWFFEEHRNAPHYWNQGFEWILAEKNTRPYWEKILPAEVQKHPILSTRFKTEESDRQMFSAPDTDGEVLRVWNLSEISQEEQTEELYRRLTELQHSIDLGRDLPFGAVLVERAEDQPDSLILWAHHLVVDAVSWSLLLREMGVAYQRLKAGQDLKPEKSESVYFQWARQLSSWADSGRFKPDLTFWKAQLDAQFVKPPQVALPSKESKSVSQQLTYADDRLSALKSEVHQAFNTTNEEILLAALLLCFRQSWGQEQLSVQMEHNGRVALDSRIDFTRAVGWFTSSYPLLFHHIEPEDLAKLIKETKETLRSVPNSGLSYGVLRYLSADSDLQQSPDLFFNYLGSASGGQQPNTQMIASDRMRHPDSERNRRLEVNIWLDEKGLHATWTYDPDVEKTSGLTDVLDSYPQTLYDLIDFCLGEEETQYSPSDFPDADLNQDELDNLLGQLDL